MSKVVITGVAGFLGSHLADKFLDEGYEVIGLDNLLGGYVSNVPDGVDFFQVDLAAPVGEIQWYFEGADLVIHAACTAYEGLSVFSPSLINMNTSQATINSVVASINAGVKKFVYLSSMARYGDQGKICDESDIPKPQDPYGISKLAAEKFVENLCDVHGIDWVVLVPHNIIGARQKYDDPFRNVASIMINRMLQGKQPIIYGDGEQQRCFSFVTDVINPVYEATIREPAIGQVFNIGPDEETVTINNLAKTIAELMDFDLDPIYVTGRPQEVKVALLSADKARRELDYKTTTSLRDGLTQMIAWITKAGVKKFDYNLPLEIDSPLVPKTWSQRLM